MKGSDYRKVCALSWIRLGGIQRGLPYVMVWSFRSLLPRLGEV